MTTLDHVSVLTRDIERARPFYRDVLGLTELARPAFKTPGLWFGAGDRQVHVVMYPAGTFRSTPSIDNNDCHFALRVPDYEAALSRMTQFGFDETAADGDPKRILAIRNGPAGFPQAYLLDPDWNVVEINATSL